MLVDVEEAVTISGAVGLCIGHNLAFIHYTASYILTSSSTSTPSVFHVIYS